MSDKVRKQAFLLAAETSFDWRTALRWLQRKAVKRGTEAALAAAAAKLEITRAEPAQGAS